MYPLFVLLGGFFMEKTMIIFNQSSGKDTGKELAEKFVAYGADQGVPKETFVLQETGPDVETDKILKKAQQEKIQNLIIIGGDGTINHAIQDFEKELPNLRIGLLPGGTVNNLAKVLGIPAKFEAAADIILKGETKKIDYGKVNDRVIISTLTIGILADTAAHISQKEKQKYGKLIFVKNFLKLVIKKKRYKLEIKTDKQTWRGKVQLVSVTMTNSVGGFTNFDDSASADDGLFHVTILPRLHFFPYLLSLPKVLKGKIYELPQLEYLTAGELTISGPSKKSIATRTDGDPSDNLPIKMTMNKQAITVFAADSE